MRGEIFGEWQYAAAVAAFWLAIRLLAPLRKGLGIAGRATSTIMFCSFALVLFASSLLFAVGEEKLAFTAAMLSYFLLAAGVANELFDATLRSVQGR